MDDAHPEDYLRQLRRRALGSKPVRPRRRQAPCAGRRISSRPHSEQALNAQQSGGSHSEWISSESHRRSRQKAIRRRRSLRSCLARATTSAPRRRRSGASARHRGAAVNPFDGARVFGRHAPYSRRTAERCSIAAQRDVRHLRASGSYPYRKPDTSHWGRGSYQVLAQSGVPAHAPAPDMHSRQRTRARAPHSSRGTDTPNEGTTMRSGVT